MEHSPTNAWADTVKQKALRGPALQKALADSSNSRPPSLERDSALANKLLSLWAHGQMPATLVRELAHLAMLDGAQHADLQRMAKCGDYGATDGNVAKSLQKAFCKAVDIIEPIQVEVPCVDPKTNSKEVVEAPLFLPHMWFSSLYHSFPEQFHSLFATKNLEKFWKGAETTVDHRLQGHPMKGLADWRSKVVPLYFHGDGVEFQERDSLMVWSFGCVLCKFSSLDGHMLLAVFPKVCTSADTWKPLEKWLVWSFTSLLAGVHPALDPDGKNLEEGSVFYPMRGQPLTSAGFRGSLWSIQGDHDFFSNVLKLPHWQNEQPCWECDCTNNTGPLRKRFKIIQPHLQNWVYVDTETAKARPRSCHALFSIPGVTTQMVRGDGLHILWKDGVVSHMLGSTLHYICWKEPPGTPQIVKPCERLAIVWQQIQQFYQANNSHTRLTNLKLTMICKNQRKPCAQRPHLHAKDSETKHLAPAVLAVCKALLDRDSEVDRHIVCALENICQLVDVFDSADMFLTPAEYDVALTKARCFFDAYAWLNRWANDNDKLHFHIVLKFHTFWHLVRNSKFLNPRCCWCFNDEDFVGRISTLAKSCISGVRSTRLASKLASKYRVLMQLRFTRHGFGD